MRKTYSEQRINGPLTSRQNSTEVSLINVTVNYFWERLSVCACDLRELPIKSSARLLKAAEQFATQRITSKLSDKLKYFLLDEKHQYLKKFYLKSNSMPKTVKINQNFVN